MPGRRSVRILALLCSSVTGVEEATVGGQMLEMHGLQIRTDLPLAGVPAGRPGAAPDLHMRRGLRRHVPDQAPRGCVWAAIERGGQDGTFATLVGRGQREGWTLRVHGVCDVEIEGDLKTVILHSDPTADLGLTQVLATGLVISVVCLLRGHLVLHASCVQWRNSAVAIVGRSGAGKSTTATLLCRAGARLITDDVLRVDPGSPAWCYAGTTENRLRSGAAGELATGYTSRSAADGRVAVALPSADRRRLPLRRILIPYPDRSAADLTFEHVTSAHALLLLSAFPRVPGWCHAASRARQFELTAELVRSVPVVVATMPWGPPFPPSLGRALLDAVDDEV